MALKSAKDLALLAGRKLLLADDSITIQKVVDLTFADEGVKVFTCGSGEEAVKKLDEIVPDVVLADVFMAEMNGYELCEYIKRNERFKHIPVMLLVGSFEPFDEAEARRVGADDTLTKPFASIRRLIDRVGGLMTKERPTEEQIPTAELPAEVKQEAPAESGPLSDAELEIVTADTQPLPENLRPLAESTAPSSGEIEEELEQQSEETKMETSSTTSEAKRSDRGEALLELDEIASAESAIDDEFELDLEFNDEPEPEPMTISGRSFVEPQIAETQAPMWQTRAADKEVERAADTNEMVAPFSDQLAETQEFPRELTGFDAEPKFERITDDEEPRVAEPVVTTAMATGQVTLDQLSPEAIDAIVQRVVERMSDSVVREIAWEVVPQLAELLIKRQLEEKQS